jgi:hypothetical protein
MNDPAIWNTYSNTIQFLVKVYNDTSGKVHCLPAFKVIEDEQVVGILTETNQFIQLSTPVPVSEINDDIRELRDNNYMLQGQGQGQVNRMLVDAYLTSSSSSRKDENREEYIKKIKLETNFFHLFRNTIRLLLNDYEYLKLREEIEEESKNIASTYNTKLDSLVRLLQQLVGDKILFVEDFDLKQINDTSMTTCIVNDEEDKCNAYVPLCKSEGTTCKMILPKKNLLTKTDNEKKYYLRAADELIRYNRIKSFMFEPQMYLSFGKVDYNLREDEMIIMQSLLTQEYFDSLIPAQVNKYVKHNTRDDAKPLLSQVYENKV